MKFFLTVFVLSSYLGWCSYRSSRRSWWDFRHRPRRGWQTYKVNVDLWTRRLIPREVRTEHLRDVDHVTPEGLSCHLKRIFCDTEKRATNLYYIFQICSAQTRPLHCRCALWRTVHREQPLRNENLRSGDSVGKTERVWKTGNSLICNLPSSSFAPCYLNNRKCETIRVEVRCNQTRTEKNCLALISDVLLILPLTGGS